MIVEELAISGVKLITPKVFHDNRGFFLESYRRSEFAKIGINQSFVQDNYSRSAKGVLRGIHYQVPPFAQGKLVMVMSGAIVDVAVDLRRDSSTYSKWVMVSLSADKPQMLWVPEGFAHGFLTLVDDTKVCYKVTAEYSHAHERGICWNDAMLNINWPMDRPILTEKDRAHPPFETIEQVF